MQQTQETKIKKGTSTTRMKLECNIQKETSQVGSEEGVVGGTTIDPNVTYVRSGAHCHQILFLV